MTDWPGNLPLPVAITNFNSQMPLRMHAGTLTVTTFSWPAANDARYCPVSIDRPFPVRRMFWFNGSTITTSAASVGIYTADGQALWLSGAVTLTGASVAQYVTVTPELMLVPGDYYFGYSCNNTTSRTQGTSTGAVANYRQSGVLQQATAHPLPQTATFAAVTAVGMPIIGVSRFASGF